jgi:homoserine kinase type II
MAVFTSIGDDEARRLLLDYQVGDFVALEGISAGIENTNYFLTTTEGEYVLTVFEVLTHAQLPFYVELMHHLSEQRLPVAVPQTRRDGTRISTMHDKPTIIVTRLSGQWVKSPSLAHCELAAQTMAKLHLAGQHFSIKQPNLRGLAWWQETAPRLTSYLSHDQQALLTRALSHQVALNTAGRLASLPYGPAHCDFFRDNVLFNGDAQAPVMGGVIDFYFAGCDYWLFDMAVAVNDWCIERDSGALIPEKTQAWLDAYQHIRPLTENERALWPDMLEAAALRFWISRLFDFHKPRPAETLKPHDPTHFERVLRLRVNERPPTILQDE